MRTLYDVLGVHPTASMRTLRRAWLTEARRWHPDVHPEWTVPERAMAQRRLAEINAAWEVLGDAGRRAAYDEENVDIRPPAELPPLVPPGFFPDGVSPARKVGPSGDRVQLSLRAATCDLSRLRHLAPGTVWRLDLSGQPIEDDDLIHVAALESVRSLVLADTAVTGRGLAALVDLPLHYLDLSHTGVGDDGLRFVGRLVRLEVLNLTGTGVTDDGLAHLDGLEELDWLILRGSRVRGPGLRHLHGLADLDYVSLPYQVDRSARRALSAALPKLVAI